MFRLLVELTLSNLTPRSPVKVRVLADAAPAGGDKQV